MGGAKEAVPESVPPIIHVVRRYHCSLRSAGAGPPMGDAARCPMGAGQVACHFVEEGGIGTGQSVPSADWCNGDGEVLERCAAC
eukprot:5274393-Prorocentrum_lima.AAC.1